MTSNHCPDQPENSLPHLAVLIRYWFIPLAETFQEAEWALLSPAERARAQRFIHARHAAFFIHARAGLRRILGHETGLHPAAIAVLGAEGERPFVEHSTPLFFNVSHSGNLAVIAVSTQAVLGVDLEYRRPIETNLVERFFSPAEQLALAGLEGEAWITGFYRCWTRKEAFVKALGQGLMLPLDQFDVSIGREAQLLRCNFAPAADWSFASLCAPPGYEAVVAVEAKGRAVTTQVCALE